MFKPGGTEILILVLIVLLLFGAARLPKLARSLREAKDEFQKENSESKEPAETTAEPTDSSSEPGPEASAQKSPDTT